MMLSPSLFFAVALLVVATLTVDSAVQPGYHGETEYAREKRQTADETICRPNCLTFRPEEVGGCITCHNGFDPPGCCNCTQGKENIGGTCKCEANVKTDGSEDCKEGYAPEDCCNCASGYTKNGNGECKRNVCDQCMDFSSLTGECSSCTGGFVLPTCCNCPTGKFNIGGTCKCSINVKTDGSGDCKEGYAPEDCCNCTSGYTKNGNGECKQNVCDKCVGFNSQTGECSSCTGGFVPPTCCNCPADKTNIGGTCKCRLNVETDGSGDCKEGYAPEDCCKCRSGYSMKNGICEPGCSINQNIYFLLDGTRQNYAFCTMGITIQMLVAALNPGLSSSGTRISTVLFPRNGEANVVFDTGNSCDQIEGTLKTLQTQMQTCQDNQQVDKSVITYTSLCGSNAVAVAGLDKIHSLIPKPATTDSAVVILTDGMIDDPEAERVEALRLLGDSGLRVQSVIAGGIRNSGATDANLRLYTRQDTDTDRVVLANDAISLGLDLVGEMEDVGLICPGLAKNITSELKKVQTDNSIRNNFCRCHNIQRLQLLENLNPPWECIVDYPTCGGSVSINAVERPKKEKIYQIVFSLSAYTVSEDDGFVELVIIKIPASISENVTLTFSTSDGTAQALFDYIPQNLDVIFGPDESEISIPVQIINDPLREHSEILYGTLVTLPQLSRSMVTIEISYNDCDCDCNIDDNSNCTCHDGYFGNGFICPDDDECANGRHNCDMNANCTNINGRFECTCNDGFFGDGKTCISTANESLINCPCNSSENCYSFEDNGTEICGCFPGYKHVDGEGNQMCTDINECKSYNCGNGTCVNIPGSYVCTCPPGYIFNLDMQQCTDLDECRTGVNECNENATCSNTEGSYDCTCLDGFIGNGITCFRFDNSDCGTLNCSQLCVNTTGSLTCACHPGYFLNILNLRECEDLDECQFHLYSCDINAECKNTIGSYECQCRSGYRGNGQICNDINECITGLNSCPENSNCRNSDGNYSCGVPPDIEPWKPERPNHNLSYTVGINFCLEDMDSVLPNMIMECSLRNEPDPPPEFTFIVERIQLSNSTEMLQMQLSNDSILQLNETAILSLFNMDTKSIIVTCVVSNTFGSDCTNTTITICDPTECQDGVTNNCTQNCTRTTSMNGTSSYECGCNQGYELNLDNATCDDIDECSMTCFESENRICNNTIGSYECDCKDGYQKNKTSQACEDINECQNRTLCLQFPLKYCVNTQGSYFCQCMAGFENSTSGECIDINECATNRHNCSDRMDCLESIGSYECVCKDGYNFSIGFEDECQDVNECMSNPCHPNATCTNENGTFTCECDAGYEGNGFICQEIQPDSRSSQSDPDLVTISSIVGTVAFLLVIGIVAVLACTCYYVRKSSDINTKKESDVIDHTSPKDQNKYGEFHLDSLPMTISVQSSYKLDLPPYLLVHAADIKLMEPIGQGEFGIVYKGYVVKDQGSIMTDIVAIKTLKGLYDRSTVRDMLKECAKMYKFDHSNVLTLKGVCLDGGTAPYIIMPFMANGSLLAYLKKNRETLVVPQSDKDKDNVLALRKRLMDWCIQVAKGMEYLASKKMVHRDLAARNCMIDMNFVIKVADFGLAESMETKEYFREDKSSHIKLPLRWLAPESMDDYVFSEKSDIWAYGVTCWEIFSGGKVPYGGVDMTDLSRRLADGYRLEKPNNDACNDQLYKFMLQCWEFEPVNRPRFAIIVSALSISLEALAGYVDFGVFGGNAMETSGKCGETFKLKVEEQSMCPTSSEEKPQDEELIPDESTV